MHNPKISIITPVFNGTIYIEKLILSIQNQKYDNIEHIIFDDGSDDKDELVKIINKYPEIKFYSRENKGQYHTLNDGLKLITGDIVTIISADDIYCNDFAFRDIINFWNDNPEFDMLYGKTSYINSKGKKLNSPKRFLSGSLPIWLLKHYSLIMHCSLFVKKDVIINNNIFFDPTFKYFGDWDWIIRLLKFKMEFVETYVSSIRRHGNQTLVNANPIINLRERKYILKKHGLSFLFHITISNVLQFGNKFIKLISFFRKK